MGSRFEIYHNLMNNYYQEVRGEKRKNSPASAMPASQLLNFNI
jgi:hypothetical protein